MDFLAVTTAEQLKKKKKKKKKTRLGPTSKMLLKAVNLECRSQMGIFASIGGAPNQSINLSSLAWDLA